MVSGNHSDPAVARSNLARLNEAVGDPVPRWSSGPFQPVHGPRDDQDGSFPHDMDGSHAEPKDHSALSRGRPPEHGTLRAGELHHVIGPHAFHCSCIGRSVGQLNHRGVPRSAHTAADYD